MSNCLQVKLPLVLAIDTSCDETSVAIALDKVVLANVIASQAQIHEPYGGVFPTLAKQAHRENIEPAIKKALAQARVLPEMLDVIAVTVGPGLAPALEVGIEHAVKLAQDWQKPLLAINHVEAHLLSVLAERKKQKLPVKEILEYKKNKKTIPEKDIANFLSAVDQNTNQFPVLGIIVSGGHSQFVQIDEIGKCQILGETVDDAIGEALDKVGRMIGLGYPAGPVMEIMAKKGDMDAYQFPLPMTTSQDFNLSYSGLKTSAHRLIKELGKENLTKKQTFDFAASFQKAVFRHLCYKLDKLLAEKKAGYFKQVWMGGGVASNAALRHQIRKTIKPYQLKLLTPFGKRLCSDNAAMIAVTASLQINHQLAKPVVNPDRKPSWNL